jgi:hypothetical protein
MLFTTVLFGVAVVAGTVIAAGNGTNTTTSNPSRYVRAPIYRRGPVNNPQTGYYWIDLGFGKYTASCIVDSGIPPCTRGKGVDGKGVGIYGLRIIRRGIKPVSLQRIILLIHPGRLDMTPTLARMSLLKILAWY